MLETPSEKLKAIWDYLESKLEILHEGVFIHEIGYLKVYEDSNNIYIDSASTYAEAEEDLFDDDSVYSKDYYEDIIIDFIAEDYGL